MFDNRQKTPFFEDTVAHSDVVPLEERYKQKQSEKHRTIEKSSPLLDDAGIQVTVMILFD